MSPFFPVSLLAKREHPEKWYQQKWCEGQKGRVEVVLQDGTRCDCLTDTHAIEFDFGGTWILHESETSRCKAFKGDVVLLLLRALNPPASPEPARHCLRRSRWRTWRLAMAGR